MMKYEAPQIEVQKFRVEDIITTSDSNDTPEDEL